MTLKKVLIFPLLVSIVLFIVFSSDILKSFEILRQLVPLSSGLVVAMLVAVVLQLAGHVVRAYKMRYILMPVRQGTTKFQFRALSLGYLFNTVLPLRIGELIRSYVIATGEKTSWGLSLMLVVFERGIDALFLLVGLAILLGLGWVSWPSIMTMFFLLLVFMAVVSIGIYATLYEQRYLISLIDKGLNLFNQSIRQGIRFKVWSVIYGLQKTITRKRMGPYLLLSLTSWGLYFASAVVVVAQFGGTVIGAKDMSLISASPYYGVSIPAGPAGLGAYSAGASAVTEQVRLTNSERTTLNLTLWALVVLPISGVALILFLVKTKEPFRRKLKSSASSSSLMDKLAREEDISQEMDAFLDNYFSGNPLSKIVHRLERSGTFHLLKYFKGGSDAITILASEKKGETVVKKIIMLEYKDRLKAQYDWLKRHEDKGIVVALGEETGDDYYAINLSYDPRNDMFFDYLHQSSSEDNQRVMEDVWKILSKTLYKKTKTVTDYDALDAYVIKHIWGCLDKAIEAHPDIATAVNSRKVWINGIKYDNIREILKKIMAHKQARKDLATFARAKEVDGDIAVDNILVSGETGRPLIIDPAPDGNIITGPVFDFGKNMQSLYCGYEFLFRSSEKVSLEEGNRINFQDQRSGQYIALCEYIRTSLAPKYLSKGEQKAIIFHAAALHIRRLKHQVKQNPDIALAMYAVGVRSFNDFLDQYH